LSTTATYLIKVFDTAPSVPKGSRVTKKSIESIKTGIVAVMTIFWKKRRNLWNTNLQNLDKLALNLKKLVINQTKFSLNSEEKHVKQATKPGKGASKRLIVKQ
jgi:hypothetical protein